MVAMTLTVSAGIGTAGATTPATKLTVCKGGVSNGKSRFSINGGASFAVGAYQCVSKTVPAGENLVTELVDPTKATTLWWIAVRPMSANVVHKVKNSKSQAGYAKVNVASGADVTVSFIDQTVPGVEVCAIAGSVVLNGQFLGFTEQAGSRVVGPFWVQAEPAGTTLDCSSPTEYPVGTVVNIAEAPASNVSVTNVTGASWAGGQDAVATVSHGTTVVTYTNGYPILFTSYLEVCVQAGDASVGRGPWTFTISGNGQPSQTESVLTGQCSGDVALPVGYYTVTETLAPPDSVSAITGGPTAPVSTDLGSGSGVFAVASSSTETATFTNDS